VLDLSTCRYYKEDKYYKIVAMYGLGYPDTVPNFSWQGLGAAMVIEMGCS